MAPNTFVLSALAALLSTASSQPSGSCASNHTPCPPPTWTPTWNLTMSTLCQPSSVGYFVMPAEKPWGLVSLDWSVARSIWQKNGNMNGTVEATSTEGCRQLKEVSPNTKCFIYHNMELALEALESQRKVMYDDSKAFYFLQYTDGNGNKNGTIYNEPGGPGAQYFWDYRVPEAAQYYIDSVVNTTMSPFVDGTFTDDIIFPEEHGNCPNNIKMNASDVLDMQYATSVVNGRLIDKAVAAGKYVWAAFGAQDGVGPTPKPSTCATFMRARCDANAAAYQKTAITQACDSNNINQTLASFLITRPPIGFFGFGWESDMKDWRTEFLWDVGVPSGALCTEGPSGVFSRPWSYGSVTLDCNKWTAQIPTA